jgi:hypothetical protein
LQTLIGKEVKSEFFCHHDETINHLFFRCQFAKSIWSVTQIGSTLYPPRSVTNMFGNWLNGVDLRFKTFIRVEAITIIWSLWLCKNDKVFLIKILPCHWLFAGALLCSVRGLCFSTRRIKTYLWRYLHDWTM